MRPLALARKEPGTGAYIDAEGRRIENRLERVGGTYGRSVIWPSNSRAQRPGTLAAAAAKVAFIVPEGDAAYGSR